MSTFHDPELDDVLQDDELVRLAGLLRSTRRAEPPLDEAFRSELRRQLMQQAWAMGEGRTPWWRRLSAQRAATSRAPSRTPVLAWAGAAAGIILIATVAVYTALQQPGELVITSPIADTHAVKLQTAILVSFNQPMDHKSTEAAVQIAPATYVSFSWQQNTLAVQPTSGNLAPSTQYQVTIGPGAKTQSGQSLTTPKTITFVTQPSAKPIPSPSPSPRASPSSLLAGDHRMAGLPPSGRIYTPQWSADSTTVYFVADNGALDSVTVSDGVVKVVVPDGVSFPAIAPAGDRFAYYRGGKIEMLTLATSSTASSTADVATVSSVSTISWVKDQLLWGTNGGGVFKASADGPTQLAAIPQDAIVLSIAPDGGHAVYQESRSLSILDLATSKSIQFGDVAAGFLGWSPDGSRMLYTSVNGNVVADDQGRTVATILSGNPSWSSQDEILIGNETDLYAVRPDGFGLTRLSSGTYLLPTWAPNGATFAYVRGSDIWSATAPAMPAEPSTMDQAAAQVSAFMNARLAGQSDQARSLLDDQGKQAYASGGLPLLITGDAHFSRFYVLAQEITAGHPDTARFVVRLVLTRGTLDVSDYEETLTLQRDQASHPFLIDQATASPTRDLGKGAEVVSVEVAAGSIKVVFDSDLVSNTVADGVIVLDGNGKRLDGSSTYANRTVVITGLQLSPGATYKLVVLTTVQDVGLRSVPTEYDLNLVGPAPGSAAGDSTGGQGGTGNPSPQPSPSPAPSASPIPTPSPVGSPTS